LYITATIINCLNIVWYSRNQKRFADKIVPFTSAINLVIANVALTEKFAKSHAYSSIYEFMILKTLHVPLKFLSASVITYFRLDKM
jgi:hypothetical protein